MYVRIARFEGGNAADIEAEVAEMRKDVEAVRSGGQPTYMPEGLSRVVRKLEVFADRQKGTIAVAVHCDSEADIGEADRILAGMSPRNGMWGKRVSSDVYEVVLDETTHLRVAA